MEPSPLFAYLIRLSAAFGDKFSVRENDNATLFRVAAMEGNDERLVVEVSASNRVAGVWDFSRTG